jgi:hypothetical protein
MFHFRVSLFFGEISKAIYFGNRQDVPSMKTNGSILFNVIMAVILEFQNGGHCKLYFYISPVLNHKIS